MRKIHIDTITAAIKNLCIEANCNLCEETVCAYKTAITKEKSPLGKTVLAQLIKNAEVAHEQQIPFCQDTGYAVFFIELGQEVKIEGGNLTEAINEGVRQGYTQGYLRKSIVINPI